MNEHLPLDPTVDIAPAGDELDAGLAAAFGSDSGPPLPTGGSVLKALSAGLPSVPRVLLREPESFGASPIVRPSSEEMPDRQDPAARLQLHGEIARGGMGAVLKGRDMDLGRDVAVKVLLETHQGRSEMLQRFVEEAQISGQLQHPGIAPVYELGQFVDKRPYFTMKLVKGKTLATLLATRKTSDEERTRFVGIFTQICQTLAYAHARGVIHRDLKPSNVMVGAFGEVQVMDWGLAKVLREGGIADELKARQQAEVSVIRTLRDADAPEVGSQTQAGTVLGTPAYMAPEQARGEVALVDERADVFGLGAMLCEILTGQPPYTGKGAELQHKARNAKLDDAFARLDGCGVDAELIALTRHCLAAEPWERPHHAGEVAEQVIAYQQSVTERLRHAELAETEARARAEEESKTRAEAEARLAAERQARRLTLGLAAAVLLALTLAGGGGLWYQRQRAEAARLQAELREGVKAALDKVTDLRQRARWAEARAVLEQVRQRLGPSGPEDLRREVEQAEKDLELVDRLDAARLKASVWVDSHFDNASAVREYEAAFREAGIGEPTESAEVVAERIRASAVREQLVAAVDDWAYRVGKKEQARRAWLLAVARAADPDSWRDRYRDPALWEDRTALERLANEAKVSELSPQILSVLEMLLRRGGADTVPLLRVAQRRYPSDFWLNFGLGTALLEAKRYEEAIGYYRAALAVRPESIAVYNNLGLVLKEKGRLDEAIDEYNKALELDPTFAYAHNGLGLALRGKGRLDEAIAAYKKAIDSAPRYAHPYCNLGNALHDKGRLDEAIAEHKKAIELDPNLVQAHNGLGIVLRDKGRLDEAIAAYKKTIEVDPKYATAHNNLGNALSEKGRLDEAIAAYKKAIELDPKYATAHENLGDALVDKGRLDEALAEYKKAVELNPEYVTPHYQLGNHLRKKGRLDEAVAAFRKAIELDPKLPRLHNSLGAILCDDKDDYDGAIAAFRKAIELDPKDDLAHNNLGIALKKKGRLDEAIAEYKKAIELDPKYAAAHYNLGEALVKKGRLDEAIAEYNKVLKLEPKDVESRNSLGEVLVRQGRIDEAIALFKRAIELDPKDVGAHNNLGNILWSKGQADEAIAECKKAIELDPKFASAHNSLGGILWEGKHDYDGAIAAFRAAIKLHPKYASAHSNLGAILCDGKQDYDGAIAAFRKAIELDPTFADAHTNLGRALLGKGRLDEAIAAWRKAVKLDPKVAKAPKALAFWEPIAALQSKLPAFLEGKYQPRDKAERFNFVQLCVLKKYHRAAAQLYADAFAAEPKQADDLEAGHRYNAACCAALAAASQGQAAAKLDAKERTRWLKQALDWLRADLALLTKQANSSKQEDRQSVQNTLRHWQLDSDLSGIREAKELAKLPADERQACGKLWADVASLLKKSEQQK